MKVLEKREMMIMGAQLGIKFMAHMPYANGTFAPVVANSPSKGWKYPSYGVSARYVCLALMLMISVAVVLARFSEM